MSWVKQFKFRLPVQDFNVYEVGLAKELDLNCQVKGKGRREKSQGM